MGGKGGGGKKGQELIKTAVRVGQQTERQSLPSRTLGFGQATELMATGGIGARLPVIAKALEAARNGMATGRTNLEQSLASNSLAGTPFGNAQLMGYDIAAGLGEANVQQQAANNAISQIAQLMNLGPVVAAPFAGGTSAAITTGNMPGQDMSGLYAGIGSVLGAAAANHQWGGNNTSSSSWGTTIGPTQNGGNLSPVAS